jgi:hypothetical protein
MKNQDTPINPKLFERARLSGTCSPLQADIHQGAQQSRCTSDAVYMAATDLFTGTNCILDSQEPSVHELRSGE